jgi:2-amino-4-hydroxy-6-hydroxymethyldihydropteridine diphosphokinase
MKAAYLIALGSNRPHGRHGPPRRVLAAAIAALGKAGIAVTAASPVIASRPVGPSLRSYANGAALVETHLSPPELLDAMKRIEREFGRRPGQLWSARVLDLDIVLWAEGCWAGPGLTIPHPAFRERDFVLAPAITIAGDWRDPLTGFTLRQLQARLTRPRPLPIRPSRHPWR